MVIPCDVGLKFEAMLYNLVQISLVICHDMKVGLTPQKFNKFNHVNSLRNIAL